MKARCPTKDALSLIRTELKNRAIADRPAGAGGTEIDDETATSVLSRMSKQRRESVDEYQKAGRQDLVDKESLELSVIESFLPKQLTEAELAEIIQLTITEVGVFGPKDFGKLMKALMPKVKGKADGKLVQAKIKEILG